MTDKPKPDAHVTFERVFCPRHGEPFRVGWPEGYPTFAVSALGRAKATIEGLSEIEDGEAWVAALERALDAKPLCCRLSVSDLIALYRSSRKDWPRKSCSNCGAVDLGSPYKVAPPNRPPTTYAHVCFPCVVTRMLEISGDG